MPARDVTKKQVSKPEKLFNHKIDSDAYNYIAKESSLIAIQMVSSHFDVSPNFFAKNDKVKIDLCHYILSTDLYEKENIIAGIFRYEVIAKVVRTHVLSARADFLAVYDLPNDAAENESKAFCARVGLFAAYPYFRALFSHHCSVGNVELPILPVLSADPLRRQSGKQTAEK